jgi:mannosyltransferase
MSVRSPAVLGALAAILAAAGVLRFGTLGLQSYHHDEAWTVVNVLTGDFRHMLHQVKATESNPPLYYVLAWGWSRLFGLGEVGLRSLSALFGLAVVPVGYLIGRQLSGRRAGLILAAFLAFNPMLIWYSQEARSYVLLIFFGALSFYFFLRVLDGGGELDLVLWTLSSALALCSHYFAFFAVGIEALWLALALRSRWRLMLPALIGLGAVGLALLPLVSFQTNAQHIAWIAKAPLENRLIQAAAASAIGETGSVLGHPPLDGYATVPLLLAAAAAVLLLVWGRARERRGAALAATVGFGVVGLAVIAAALGKDYVIARNLLPALVPLLVAVAIGATLRGARRRGALLAAVLAVYSLGFCVWVSASPTLQRPDWDAVAARLGEPAAPRAIVSWTLGAASLRYYLSTGSFQVQPADGFSWSVHEVDFVSDGPAPPVPSRLLGPRFRQVGYEPVGRLYVRRYALPGPDLAPLRLGEVRDAQLNFRSNGVLLDGIGPD